MYSSIFEIKKVYSNIRILLQREIFILKLIYIVIEVIRKEKFKREENKYIFILLYRISIYERLKIIESNIYIIVR